MHRTTSAPRHAVDSRFAQPRRHRPGFGTRRRFRFDWERVEERTLLSTITWANDVSGDWDNPSMWTGGAVPGPGDDAVIGFSDITVTHASSASDSVNSLTSQGAIAITGGSLSVASTSSINNTLSLSSGATLTGAGDITVSGLFDWESGALVGPQGSSLTADGGILSNGGNLDGRTLDNVGAATFASTPAGLDGGFNLADGAVFNNGSPSNTQASFTADVNYGLPSIYGDGTFNNYGAFAKTNTAPLSFGIPFNSTGSVIVQQASLGLGNATNSGTVTVSSGTALGVGSYTQTAGATILNGGTINGGALSINGGALSGTGTINANVTNGGQVIPGGTGAAGLLTINGNYTQTATGSLNIELGGTVAGSSDQLVVSGAATLGGALNVATIGSFTPALGNTFQVMTFGSSSGNFNTYNGTNLANGLFLDPVFSSTSLTLDTDQVAISGAPAFPLEGNPTNLTGSATGPSAGNPFTFSWTVTQNGNPFQSGSGSTFSFTPNLNATYQVTLTVTDAAGGKGTATLQVIVAPSIFVLNPSASGALTVSGNASINIPGEVVVDSSSSSALSAAGNAQITASVIDVLGGFQKTGSAAISPAPRTGVSVPDPLTGLSGPSTTGLTNYGSVNLTGGSQVINPGIYGQIKVSGGASLTLNPGTYLVEGGGLTVTGNAGISGQNVFIYNAGSNYPNSGGNFGGITLSGTGTFNLSAPTSGPYAGILIFQSRQNTRALSFSGNALAGMTGVIYAPNALLSMSGNATLQSALDVGMLNLSGNVSLTQIVAGSDGSGDASGIANTLLAGNLTVSINDPSGLFTADELARIQDAINAWNAILAPYNVTITEVSDPSLANLVIDTSTATACGGMANGVLGCYNEANSEITMVQGWNWYAGSDPSQIGAGQYDFETTVLHELGHALGLGGSTDTSSPMYETLAAGVADRTPTTQDLNIPDPPEGADPQMAAGFAPASTPLVLSTNGFATALGSGPNPNPAGLMPLPPAGATSSSSVQFSVLSFQGSATGSQTNSQVGPGSSLVVQGMDPEGEHSPIPWLHSDSTDLSPPLDLPLLPAELSVQPAADPQIGAEHHLRLDGTDRGDEPVGIPSGLHTDPPADSALNELASEMVLMQGRKAAGPFGLAVLPVDEVAEMQGGEDARRPDESWLTPIPADLTPPKQPAHPPALFTARLAAILLAAGLCGHGAIRSARRNPRDGSLRITKRFPEFRPRTR
jgi:hypothetical protein